MGPGGRGTRSGKTYEDIIETAIKSNYGENYKKQIYIGESLFGGNYKVDFILNENIIISAKWQQVSGTAEQKILYDIASLIKIIDESKGKFIKGYIVIGGEGFSDKAKKFLLSQNHINYFNNGDKVIILTIDNFIALANNKKL